MTPRFGQVCDFNQQTDPLSMVFWCMFRCLLSYNNKLAWLIHVYKAAVDTFKLAHTQRQVPWLVVSQPKIT